MKIYEIENKLVEIKMIDFDKKTIILSVQINVDKPVRIPVRRSQFFGIDNWLSNVSLNDQIKYYSNLLSNQ
jgi:hypothetical protein